MNLIVTTPAEAASNEMLQIINELTSYTEGQLKRLHALANTPGHEQAIMDRFGPNAVTALSGFVAFRSALAHVKPSTSVPAANLEVFQPQEDGTVVYVVPPPVEEEPIEGGSE